MGRGRGADQVPRTDGELCERAYDSAGRHRTLADELACPRSQLAYENISATGENAGESDPDVG